MSEVEHESGLFSDAVGEDAAMPETSYAVTVAEGDVPAEWSERLFDYDDIEDAPNTHRELARYAHMGLPVEMAGNLCGLTSVQVRKICGHGPWLRHVAYLEAQGELRAQEHVAQFKTLFEKSLAGVEGALDRLQDLLKDESEKKLSPAQVVSVMRESLKVLQEVSDRMPGHTFVKTERREERHDHEHRHFGTKQIEALQARVREGE